MLFYNKNFVWPCEDHIFSESCASFLSGGKTPNTLSVWPSSVPYSWTVPTNERFNAANWDWFDCLWAVKEENYRHYVEQLWQTWLIQHRELMLIKKKKICRFLSLFFRMEKTLDCSCSSCITLFCVSLWWILLPAGELLPHVLTHRRSKAHITRHEWFIQGN